ncbi:hypothetical protein [Effusibacillus consociatus]|uniref:Uncharacterized protein n=1 Tax=Effusibacillus consociatus TaxID=1117041 RepID=A0ABV9PYQ3_9BACL
MKDPKLSTAFLAGLLSILLGTSAIAATGPTNVYTGGYAQYPDSSSGQMTSVYCDIKTPSYPDTFYPSASNGWPMIVGTYSNGADKVPYVQVGWVKANGVFSGETNGEGVRYFWEHNDRKGHFYRVFSAVGPAENTTHGYRVYYEAGDWKGTVDGGKIGSYPKIFTSLGAQYYEELVSQEDVYRAAYAGTSTNHARFSNIRYFFNNTTYYSPTLNMSSDGVGKYDQSNYSSTKTDQSQSYIEFWDSRR